MFRLQRYLGSRRRPESVGRLQVTPLPEIIARERTVRHLPYVRERRPDDATVGGIKNYDDALSFRRGPKAIRQRQPISTIR